MKKCHQLFRGIAFATALALTTEGIQAQTASAMPRNPCRDYLNQARANQTLGRWWLTHGQMLLNLGLTGQALDAFNNAEVFYGFADAYVTQFNQECR